MKRLFVMHSRMGENGSSKSSSFELRTDRLSGQFEFHGFAGAPQPISRLIPMLAGSCLALVVLSMQSAAGLLVVFVDPPRVSGRSGKKKLR